MAEYRDLDAFTSGDEAKARAALDRLYQPACRYMHAYLRRRFLPGEANQERREEVIVETLEKVWQRREKYTNMGAAAWYGYLAAVARSCFLDTTEAPTAPPLSDEEYDFIDGVISWLNDAETLKRLAYAANIALLELDERLPAEMHWRQLLAAHYYYRCRCSLVEVVRRLPPRTPGEQPLDSKTLQDDWLTHPGVLRYLGYQALYYSNDHLTACLLGLKRPEELTELVEKAQRQPPHEQAVNGFTWGEVWIILWRYRYGFGEERIRTHEKCIYDSEKLRDFLTALAARLPFASQSRKLLSDIQALSGDWAQTMLRSPHLCQRLAFQYRYYDDLPVEEVWQRIDPAARQVGYPVDKNRNLNAWLCGGRLLEKVCCHMQGKGRRQ